MKSALIALATLCAPSIPLRFLVPDACRDADGRVQGIFCQRG